MGVKIFLLISLLSLINSSLIYSANAKTLVLLDDWHYIETHSLFWKQLRNMGFELDYKMIDDPNIKLTYFGEYLYNNVIYFAPTYNEGSIL